MIRLPNILLLFLTTATFWLCGCYESSFVPYDDPSDALRRTIIKKWVFSDNTVAPGDSIKTHKGWVLDLRSDGSYSSSSPNSSSSNGRWTFNTTDSSLTLVPENGSATTFKLDSITKSSIKLKGSGPNDVLYLRSQTGPLFSISGPIVFEKSLSITAKHKLSVLWKASGSTSDEYIVWGQGTVDVIGSRYHVDFNTYPPDSLIARFYGCNGKIGIGTIYLHADPSVGSDGSTFTGSIPAKTIGIVKDRAMVFLFGQFEGTQCSADFPWVSTFQRGFSVGEAIVTPNQKDKYLPSGGSVNTLVITDVASTFQTPTWWK